MIPRPTISTPFPYTTLFRSRRRSEGLPAREYHLRPPPPTRRDHRSTLAPRQEGAPRAHLPAGRGSLLVAAQALTDGLVRSEEHTSELQSPDHLVCPLLLVQK